MGFIVFVIIAAVIVYNVMNKNKTAQEQWRAAAERLGLQYFPGDFGLAGKIIGIKGGHRIEVSTFSKGSGNSSQTYTKYRIEYHEPIPVDFKVTRQTALHTIGEVFGLKDIQVGDPAFDERAAIKGMYPPRVIEFLTPHRRNEIMNLLSSYNEAVITNEYLEVDKPGKESDSAVMYDVTRRLLSLCNELTDTSISLAAEKAQAEPVAEPPPLPVFEPVEPPLDQFSIPNPVVPDPPMIEPDDEDVEEDERLNEIICPPGFELNQVTFSADDDEGDDEEDYEVAPVPDAGVNVAAEDCLDLRTIAEDLFGDGVSTLTVGKLFDENYAGRGVRGTAMLKRVSKFSYDPVFKDTTGVKAIVDVCELAGAYSKIRVSAEIKFDVKNYDALKSRVGSSLVISGRLIAQDSMLHQLYVESTSDL